MLWEFYDISFQPEMDHVVTNCTLLLHGLMMQAEFPIVSLSDFDTTTKLLEL